MINRREFIGITAGAGASLALNTDLLRAFEQSAGKLMQRRRLLGEQPWIARRQRDPGRKKQYGASDSRRVGECDHRFVEDRVLLVVDEIDAPGGKVSVLPAAPRNVVVDRQRLESQTISRYRDPFDSFRRRVRTGIRQPNAEREGLIEHATSIG